MKKIISLALALMLALSLVACGGKEEPSFSVDLTEFYTNMMNAAEEPPMLADNTAEPEWIENRYPGLNDIETKQLISVSPMITAVAMEFTFVEVANAADVDAVKNILQARIDAQVNGGAWYPATVEQWEKNSEIVVIDNYVCLFVCSEKDILIDALRNGTEVPVWAKAPIDLYAFMMSLTDHYGENFPADTDVSYDAEMLEMCYPGLGDIMVNQICAYQPQISGVVCEIALIEVADSADVEAVKAILQARIDAQIDGGAWYPASIAVWENNSRIVENGNFIMMIAYSECDEVVEMFNALF